MGMRRLKQKRENKDNTQHADLMSLIFNGFVSALDKSAPKKGFCGIYVEMVLKGGCHPNIGRCVQRQSFE